MRGKHQSHTLFMRILLNILFSRMSDVSIQQDSLSALSSRTPLYNSRPGTRCNNNCSAKRHHRLYNYHTSLLAALLQLYMSIWSPYLYRRLNFVGAIVCTTVLTFHILVWNSRSVSYGHTTRYSTETKLWCIGDGADGSPGYRLAAQTAL